MAKQDMAKRSRKERISEVILTAGLAVSFYIFFAIARPLTIYDMDDWRFVTYTRRAVPLWKDWNPTRILPEVLMPFISRLSTVLFYPVNHDFIFSLTIGHALTLSLCIAAFFLIVFRFFRGKMELSLSGGLLLTLFLVLYYMLPFNVSGSGNMHMFSAYNVTCIFYYTIPSLLCASLVILFLPEGMNVFWSGCTNVQKGILVAAIYFAINSNMFPSFILIAYVGCEALGIFLEMFRAGRREGGKKAAILRDFIHRCALHLTVLAVWAVSLVFEANGGRAGSLAAAEKPFGSLFLKALKNLRKTATRGMNKLFLLTMGLCLLYGLVRFLSRRRRRENPAAARMFVTCLAAAVLSCFYTVLLAAKTKPSYARQSQCLFGVLFYVMMAAFMIIALEMKKHPKAEILLPLALCIIFNETVNSPKTYIDIKNKIPASVAKTIDEYMIEQVVEADREGAQSVEVHVPKYKRKNNWPLASYGGDRLADTCYEHHLTARRLDVTIVPDESVNELLHLDPYIER